MNPIDPTTLSAMIGRKFALLGPELDERRRRLWAASEAMAIGHGGIAMVEAATGLSRPTIEAGIAQLSEATPLEPGRVRKPGGGRKSLEEIDPTLLTDLDALIDPISRGDPQSPLRWVCKSIRHLADALTAMGHKVSALKVDHLLHHMGYSLQSNRKTEEGTSHPDRNAQFEYINTQTKDWQGHEQPVISVDCKKKELIGSFKNGGKEWQPQGQPEPVFVHDFMDKDLGKAIPYGVYDLTQDQAWVSVGCDHDTAEFAVATIERWWEQMGKESYPLATDLMIVGDGGGSNGSRCRLWKAALQGFADRCRLRLHVHHLPPGTSKWNKIEHRLFSYITLNWRGRPLISLEAIVNLIANTRTASGHCVQAASDSRTYPTKIKVSEQMMAELRLKPHAFHGEWNYEILPRQS